ncbi:MAG: hypothetical protein K1X92_17585 [Bacteroidia bacterium]|nr:hypothetical protein [Bacteroidia bacterium]
MKKFNDIRFSYILIMALLVSFSGCYKMCGKPKGEGDNPVVQDDSTTNTNTNTDNRSEKEENTPPPKSNTTFSYNPPAPQEGKLKGVVELGASGFNSFIINVDANKRWELKKAEFGASLVYEHMASDEDLKNGLKKYIAGMLDYGVKGNAIHFVVSSAAIRDEKVKKVVASLKSMGYIANPVTAEEEGKYAAKVVLPAEFEGNSFVVDIGSGNTKISWSENGQLKAFETYGSKYYDRGISDDQVYKEVSAIASKVPASKRSKCFIIGGAPYEMAKQVRNGKERYTVLSSPNQYKPDGAKMKSGVNIYRALSDATQCETFVFDWDSNFTIGFLLGLKY